MSKHKAGNRKRYIIISVALALVVASAVSGYLLYNRASQQKQATSRVTSEAKESVKSLNIVGDQDLATAYVAYVKAGNVAAAQKLFSDKVASESDTQKRIDLLSQNVLLALDNTLEDEALAAANQAASIRPGEDTYALVARVYSVKSDYGKQIEYWQKALDTVQGSNIANKDQLIALYQGRIDSTKQAQALRERASE